MKQTLFLLIFLFFFFFKVHADFDIIDEDNALDTEEHYFALYEKINIQTASRSELSQISALTSQDIRNIMNYRKKNIIINAHYLMDAGLTKETTISIEPFIEYGKSKRFDYSFQNYLRYQDKTENIRNINRFQASNNIYNLKLHHEHNSNIDNSSIPFGASLSIKTSPNANLILGQYRLEHGYGLLLSRGSFISQKPGFNVDFKKNRSILSANARPYFSRSFLGVAYEHSLSDKFTLFVYSSYKDTGAKLADEKIVALLSDDNNPKQTTIHSYSGTILHYQTGGLNLSTTVNFSQTDRDFQDDRVESITGSVAASYSFINYMIFSESAYSNSANAHLVGVKNSHQKFSQIIAYRYVEEGYHAHYANFISNSANQTNEKGLFYKIEYKNKEYSLQTFADIFSNIEVDQRYLDKNQGVSWGIKAEKYSMFEYQDMNIGLSYREKYDREWRNLDGISQYEERKREYWKTYWRQTDTKSLTTKLVFDFQQKQYPDHDISNKGYALSQSLSMLFQKVKINFTAGLFDSVIPLYLYLYSGSLNNPLLILSGDGLYAMFHVSYTIGDKLKVELMSSLLKKEKTEHTTSMMFRWGR